MKLRLLYWILGMLVLWGNLARTGEPERNDEEVILVQAGAQPPTPAANPAPTQSSTASTPTAPTTPTAGFSQAPSTGGEAPTGLNPHMIGDFPTFFALRQFTILVPPSGSATSPIPVTVTGRVPVASAGTFKIADNESPRPQDRVFFTYNGYVNLHGSLPPTGTQFFPGIPEQTIALPGGGVVTIPAVPAASFTVTLPRSVQPPQATLHREMAGFEKTFWDGNASVEVRAPLLQLQGDSLLQDGFFGDLTLILKFALLGSPGLDDVLSVGVAVTTPTGPSIATLAGSVHPFLLQPFVGGIWNWDALYVQGFSSVVVPTDQRDVTLLFNDVGLGYWLYRGSCDQVVSSLVESVEAHVTTPLNNRGPDAPITVPNLATLTGGLHLGLYGKSTLTTAVAVPVTGPHPFSVEGIAQINIRF